jgi:hypothetical protein
MSGLEYRLTGTHLGRELSFTVATELIIGRKDDAGSRVDIDLTPDQSVSRQHARIWVQDGRCWIEDLGSGGGTRVDGQEIRDRERVELKSASAVIIGQASFTVVAPAAPPPLADVAVQVRCLASFNYSLAHADVPFLQSLTITNKGSVALNDVGVRVRVIPYAESDESHLTSLPAGGTHSHGMVRFHYDRQRLLHLTEPVSVPLEVEVGGRPAALSAPVSVQVLPLRAWHCIGHEPVLAAFILKGATAIQDVIGLAARVTLRRLARGSSSFEDVIEHHPDPWSTIVKIVYNCLREHYAIAYGREPRYYGADWQVIRFPADVLDQGVLEGTCIDLALLLAACLENRSVSPVIVLIQTGIDRQGYIVQHALVGCWNGKWPRWNRTGPTDPIETDGKRLLKWLDSGELILLDPVGYACGKDADQDFKESQESARAYLERAVTGSPGYAFRYAVDVEVARLQAPAVEPLPFGAEIEFDRDAWLAIARARREAALRGGPAVGGRHLLLGLLSLTDGVLAQALALVDKDLPEKVADQVRTMLGSIVSTRSRSPWRTTPDWDAAIEGARIRAKNEGRRLVGEADLAIALVEKSPRVGAILTGAGATTEQCLEHVQDVLKDRQGLTRWQSSAMGI